MTDAEKYKNLGYEKFRELASRPDISRHEKVGFPDEYREGKEASIFADILAKLPSLNEPESTVLEIGPGCSHLPLMLMEWCKSRNSRLLWADSPEMLGLLPSAPDIIKLPGRYPGIPGLFDHYAGKVRTIVAYSVLQYVFCEGNLWNFLDRSLSLLMEGGEILLGDIPNVSMRKRFFASNAGLALHRQYTGGDAPPEVFFNTLEPGLIDDSVVFAILARARAQGFHAFVVPQAQGLPMANRREDIIIKRP